MNGVRKENPPLENPPCHPLSSSGLTRGEATETMYFPVATSSGVGAVIVCPQAWIGGVRYFSRNPGVLEVFGP